MIKIFKNLGIKEFVLLVIVIALTVAQTFLDLTLPDYMSEITLLVQTPGSSMTEILIAGGMMLLCAVGSLITAIIVAILAAKIASNLSYILRKKMFGKVMDFSMNEINSFSTSSLITRTTNDITQVQVLIIMGAQMLIKAPLTAAWAIIKIADKNMTWTLTTIIAVGVLLAIVSICLGLAIPKFRSMQKLTDGINNVTKEHLDGLAVVRAYNAEEYQEKKFEEANNNLTKVNLFSSKTMAFLMPSMQAISSGLVLAIYLIGAVLINEAVGFQQMILFSDMTAFSALAMQVIMAFIMLIMVFMILPRANVAAKRINEVLDTPFSIVSGSETSPEENKDGEIEFKDVSFKYPGGNECILSDISFKAKKGETIAFIGSTGSGKSTVINLIPRFYDATTGEVLVGGKNVKNYTKEALTDMIGYVSQKSILFKGTIKSNVTLGEDDVYNEKGLVSAIGTAQAKEFVENLKEQNESFVAQGGNNFSGGQKQRVSIARAFYQNPEILIFDDSFSALDYKTDRNLRTALKKNYKDSTKIIVGQRIGTIKDSDKIIVLEDGKIAGMGKHKELLKKCTVYKEIAESQLSKEELENE